MHGHSPYEMWALGPDRFCLGGSFQCNAAANPASTTYRGNDFMSFAVTYAATGTYTVTLGSGLILPAQPLFVAAWPQYATLATDWFECGVLGESTLNATTRQFVIQAHRNGTAREPAATAGNRINFAIFASNNTGR